MTPTVCATWSCVSGGAVAICKTAKPSKTKAQPKMKGAENFIYHFMVWGLNASRALSASGSNRNRPLMQIAGRSPRRAMSITVLYPHDRNAAASKGVSRGAGITGSPCVSDHSWDRDRARLGRKGQYPSAGGTARWPHRKKNTSGTSYIATTAGGYARCRGKTGQPRPRLKTR